MLCKAVEAARYPLSLVVLLSLVHQHPAPKAEGGAGNLAILGCTNLL